MTLPSRPIIYLSDQRGCTLSDWFRSYHTFNFGSYFSENKKPAGYLQAFNDETLKESCTRKFNVESNTGVLLIPIIGGVEYNVSTGMSGALEAGEVHLLIFPEDSELEIKNPFESDLINFLHIWLTIPSNESNVQIKRYEFNLGQNKNQFVPLNLMESLNITAHIGKYNGRVDGVCGLRNSDNGIFIFVIEGAFEVENRLLEMRDGLLLWDRKKVEFEALSDEAIILMIEFSSLME